MTNQAWQLSLQQEQAPNTFSSIQKAVWNMAKNNWNKAHQIVQMMFTNKDAARIHAYIHRVEGDNSNASFWYNQAGMPFPQENQQEEFNQLVQDYILN